MKIFQLDRYLLARQVEAMGHYISGRTLDLGAGHFDRYGRVFNCSEYVKMDVEKHDGIDVIGRAENIPFQDNSFDSVVSTQVFEHVSDPEKSAREVYRVLKTGGHLLVTVPQTNELHSEPNDYWRFTRFGLENLFCKCGFEMIEWDQRGGFFVNMSQQTFRYFIDRFRLYSRKYAGRICNRLFSMVGRLAMWLDFCDSSSANRKHTIGWCAVFRKP